MFLEINLKQNLYWKDVKNIPSCILKITFYDENDENSGDS